MKKLLFLAMIVIAATSCKKETLTTMPAKGTAKFDKTSAEDIIKHTDADLYAKVLPVFHPEMADASRTSIPPIVRIAHGIYTETSWYCIPSNCVCFIDIIFSKYEEGDPLPEGDEITGTISDKYQQSDDAKIIILNGENLELYNNVSSLDVEKVGSNIHFQFGQGDFEE